MKLLSKACAIGASCPGVHDPEDGSGELIIIGRGPLTPADEGVQVASGEGVIRISRALLEQALNNS